VKNREVVSYGEDKMASPLLAASGANARVGDLPPPL
jgi:hypothetical protein